MHKVPKLILLATLLMVSVRSFDTDIPPYDYNSRHNIGEDITSDNYLWSGSVQMYLMKVMPMNIVDQNNTLFGTHVCPNQAVQGSLGDCWLMSALASMAYESGDMVKSLFLHDVDYYQFYFNRVGGGDMVYIDDTLPVNFTTK